MVSSRPSGPKAQPARGDYGPALARIAQAAQAQRQLSGTLHWQVARTPAAIDANAWDHLLAHQQAPTPFMRHGYLQALHDSGSAVADTGWAPRFLALWHEGEGSARALLAACPLYLKAHSYGEYVFDWAWARAYAEHGLDYYPKALVAVPFTPVPGSRLLATEAHWRDALLHGLIAVCGAWDLSSLHVLLGSDDDRAACARAGLLLRDGVQFHWQNRSLLWPGEADWTDFDGFLASLAQDKRKKIRAEQRKVRGAGVRFRWSSGADITPADWAFFYRCYEQTYWEHGNAPYLTPAFFAEMARTQPENWLLFIAERAGVPIAASLIGLQRDAAGKPQTAYGRYWGALERVDSLHFDACYYQPLQWCIAHGVRRFEGGAQGEHKMARALLPTPTHSAHWLAHPAFADAVDRFLQRESAGIGAYRDELAERTPFRTPLPTAPGSATT